MKRTLTKYQERQLSYALSDAGNFGFLVSNGSYRTTKAAIDRCIDAFIRDEILEPVREGNLTYFEFTCKARDYVDTFKLQDAWRWFYRKGGSK